MPIYKVFFTAIVNAENENEATSIGRRTNLVHQKTMLLNGVEKVGDANETIMNAQPYELSPEIWMEGVVFAKESEEIVKNINFEQLKMLYCDRRTGESIFQANLIEKPEGRVVLIYIPATEKISDIKAEVVETVPQLVNFAIQKFLQLSNVHK